MDDLNFKTRNYDSNTAYRQSKQANRMLSWAFHKRLQDKNSLVTVNACHPGVINTQLLQDLGFGHGGSTEQGASTPVFLASDPSLEKARLEEYEFW
jgi:NAD(P)-dependent dehydrogenase (short-subunit alcohol dehydrogenase family)